MASGNGIIVDNYDSKKISLLSQSYDAKTAENRIDNPHQIIDMLHKNETNQLVKVDIVVPIMTTTASQNGGLSHSLSTESLRNAADMFLYDDDDDDENKYHKQQSLSAASSLSRHSSLPNRKDSRRRLLRQNSLDNDRHISLHINSSQNEQEEREQDDEPLRILNELDAILDCHSDSDIDCHLVEENNREVKSEERCEPEERVVDCLLDLDVYLASMDDDGGIDSEGMSISYDCDEKTVSLNIEEEPNDMGAVMSPIPSNNSVEFLTQILSQNEESAVEPPSTSALSSPNKPPATTPATMNSGNEILSEENIFQNILLMTRGNNSNENDTDNINIFDERPRQFGRRVTGHPPYALSLLCTTVNAAAEYDDNNVDNRTTAVRPMSAPGRTQISGRQPLLSSECGMGEGGSEPYSAPCSARTSHTASPVSLLLLTSPTLTDRTSTFGAGVGVGANTSLDTPITHVTFAASCCETTVGNDIGEETNEGSSNDANVQPANENIDVDCGSSVTLTNSITPTPTDTPVGEIGADGHTTYWPHSYSRPLALLCCTLGLFNICRFAVLTLHYGGNFLFQFVLLSLLFGIPLLWLQMCLGAKIRAGPVAMWKISPICRGIGIALVFVQCLVAIYSSVAIAWVLVYLRDVIMPNASSFQAAGFSPINLEMNDSSSMEIDQSINQYNYPWQRDIYNVYRPPLIVAPPSNISNGGEIFVNTNCAGKATITECVANYFHIMVLQRLEFGRHRGSPGDMRFRVNDMLAFNLSILWALVFLILCKGLRSFGRFIFPLTLLPLISLIAIASKFLTVVDLSKLKGVFAATDFDDFLVNSKTWAAAAQETFLTWGLLGASVIAMASRCHRSETGMAKSALRRDALLVVLLTFIGLSMAAIIGLCCQQILRSNSYVYIPGSFERPQSYVSVYSLRTNIDTTLLSYPPKWVPHYSSYLGEVYRRPDTLIHRDSGWEPLRFISELFPAVASLVMDSVSRVWVAITFFTLFLLGVGQLCAMWKPLAHALGPHTTVSAVLLSCVTGLLLSIPFATEMGICILHYVDLLLGGAWFVPLLWVAVIFGVFLIRGRPYNGDDLVNYLRMTTSISAFLALVWNVLLPIGLITLAVVAYKVSSSSQFYYWRGKAYFSYWLRKSAALAQVGCLLIVPLTALVQIYRYMVNGPPDILDRIQMLYRPNELHGRYTRNSQSGTQSSRHCRGNSMRNRRRRLSPDAIISSLDLNAGTSNVPGVEDAPPKYTPPPSYTTATGARIAKIVRRSIRRSVRRLLGDGNRSRNILTLDTEMNPQSLPPDYSTLRSHRTPPHYSTSSGGETSSCSAGSSTFTTSSSSTDRGRQSAVVFTPGTLNVSNGPDICSVATITRNQNHSLRPMSMSRSLERTRHTTSRPFTAVDVVSVLGSASMRVRRGRQPAVDIIDGNVGRVIEDETGIPSPSPSSLSPQNNSFRSIENLILNAEPLGHSAPAASSMMEMASAVGVQPENGLQDRGSNSSNNNTNNNNNNYDNDNNNYNHANSSVI